MGQETFDIAWVLICSSLVFLMQAGFTCLESGLTRSKNSINVAIKNITDFCLSVFLFWLFGYSLAFGLSQSGLIGFGNFAPELHDNPRMAVFFLFQAMFCGTATTIVSGAVAERMKFLSYLIVAMVLSGPLYCIFAHWSWNGVFEGVKQGWLAQMGFVDFAGSTVVHATGGWMALAALLIIGPRKGRFRPDGTPVEIQGSNIPIAILGVILLWLGWDGFNGGSTFAWNTEVPGIIYNTTLCAVSGLISALVFGWFLKGHPDVESVINGCLGGLVAITAGCHALSAIESVMTGMCAGVIVVFAQRLLEKFQIDDVISAFPVHGVCGMWGTLAVGLMGDLDRLGTGLSRMEQVGVQLLGMGTNFIYVFGLGYLLLYAINKIIPLRVSPEEESEGLNFVEHKVSTAMIELAREMEGHEHSGKLEPVQVEPHTEVGQIAKQYNSVIERVRDEIARANKNVEIADHARREVEKKENEMIIKMEELQDMNRIAINRELRMIEMKREVNEMSRKAGQEEPYPEIDKD